MGILGSLSKFLDDDISKKNKKKAKNLDCCYDCRECPYSNECEDDGSYLEDGDDENY